MLTRMGTMTSIPSTELGPPEAESRATDPLESTDLRDEIGLCLSGGGYRAMVFHLGALWRLNEVGYLTKISRFSSVSGGSITNGVLAYAWNNLKFQNGIAAEFLSRVAKPILAFAKTSIDVKSILVGLLPTQTAAHRVSKAYDKALFHGVKLNELPLQPRFTFNATNLMSGSLFRISPEYAADYRVGIIKGPRFALADVVAASSAFPPVLSPLDLDLAGESVDDQTGTSLHRPPYTKRAVLTDGGVYDNLGLETVWKRCRTVLVSNAGRNVFAEDGPAHSWPFQLKRVVDVIHNQADNARERQLLALARAKLRTVGYWAIETDPAGYHVTPPGLSMSPEDCKRSVRVSTRLRALPLEECALLVRHAYLLCDLALRKYVDPALQPPTAFPDIRAAS